MYDRTTRRITLESHRIWLDLLKIPRKIFKGKTQKINADI